MVPRRTIPVEESAPQLEPISPVNPQRPTERREAVAVAKRTVAAARQVATPA